MIPSDHFVRFYNEIFKYIIRHDESDLRKYYDSIANSQNNHCAGYFREKGLQGMYDYWEHIKFEENCDMINRLEDGCYSFEFFTCPSLSKVVDNDAGPCEKYCDHCPGWVLPLMTRAGFYAVYNLIDRKEPRCEMFVYTDRTRAEAKAAELRAQYSSDLILTNFDSAPTESGN